MKLSRYLILVFIMVVCMFIVPMCIIYGVIHEIKAILIEHTTDPIVIEPKAIEPISTRWWTDSELDMLAAIIYYEAGSDSCTDRHQQLVGQVVINRMTSNEFPNTIYDVITQIDPVQYEPYELVLKNVGNRDIIPQRCYDNALIVLSDGVDCPSNVVWQAEFIQGSGIYEEIHTPYGVSYFCYR